MNELTPANQSTVEQEVEQGLTVYYDGACPLCRREINFYRRRRGGAAVNWVDVSVAGEASIAPDLTRADAMARFHVRLPDGTMQAGVRGFGELWATLPGFSWLGRIARNRAAQPALEAAYRGFLKLRPALQRLAASRGT